MRTIISEAPNRGVIILNMEALKRLPDAKIVKDDNSRIDNLSGGGFQNEDISSDSPESKEDGKKHYAGSSDTVDSSIDDKRP